MVLVGASNPLEPSIITRELAQTAVVTYSLIVTLWSRPNGLWDEPDAVCRLPLERLVQGTKRITAHMGNAPLINSWLLTKSSCKGIEQQETSPKRLIRKVFCLPHLIR